MYLKFSLFNPPARGADYSRRCPSAWWAPPPSKRAGRAIPVRRVRFPSTSAKSVHRNTPRSEQSDRKEPREKASADNHRRSLSGYCRSKIIWEL